MPVPKFPKRPNYFQSQFLVVPDFQDEQAYHEELLRRHNRLLHDWGVVRDGLAVTKTGNDYVISPGSAIDSLGREIVLDDPGGKVSGDDLAAARQAGGPGQDVSITIAFNEANSPDANDKYPPPGGTENVTRMIQSPLIAATTSPATDGTVVILASIKADGTVDNTVRKPASSFIRGTGSSDLFISSNGNVGIATTNPEDQLQIGNTCFKLGLGTTFKSLYQADYGVAYLGFNAVRAPKGWRRSGDGAHNGGALIYSTIHGKLCFVTVESNSTDLMSDGDISGRKRMIIDEAGNVSMAKDLSVTGALNAIGPLNVSGALNVAGKVGIGTTTPFSQLSISSVTQRSQTAKQIIGELSFIGFNRTFPSASILAQSKDWDDTGHLIFKTSDGGGSGGAKERMRISSAGNVGIATPGITLSWDTTATPAPVTKLHVAGDNFDFPNGTGTQQSDGHVARLQDGSGFLTLDLGGFEKNGFWLQTTDIRNLATNYPLLLNPNGGNVGIGNIQPPFKLSTKDSDTIATGVLRLQNSYIGLNNDYSAGFGIELAGIDNGINGHDLRIRGRTTPAGGFSDLVIVKNNGNVGIGTMTPKASLDVGDMTTGIKSVLARMSEGNDVKDPGTCLAVTSYTTQGTGATSFAIEHYFYGNRNGYITFCRGGSSDNGWVKFGGTDLAELFESAEQIVPGDVVVFDEQDSFVKLCESEADSCVIGIVSGAPGAVLGKDDNNGSPIALCGRVPCNVDADIAPIQFGDLLTTSPTKGHAQKVLDHTKAAGAIIGKALGSLSKGKGQITVLVALA